MKNKFIPILLIIVLAFVFLSLPIPSSSASNFVISPQNVATSTSIEYCIGFYIGPSIVADNYFEMTMPAGFNLLDLTISDTTTITELEMYPSDDCTGTVRYTETSPGTPSNSKEEASITDQVITLVVDAGLTTSQWWSLKFVDKTDGDANAVVSPGFDGNYFFSWAFFQSGLQVDEGGDLLYVGELNKVNISAEVDPTLNLTISNTECLLGVFDAAQVNTCNYYVEVSTQSAAGYTTYIREDGNFRTSAGADIDDAAGDNDIDVGSEEYGVSTTESDSVDIGQLNDANAVGGVTVADCTYMDGNTVTANATALTTTDQSFATAAIPVSNDRTYLCHGASISGTTSAGSYSHIVTITLVGNF